MSERDDDKLDEWLRDVEAESSAPLQLRSRILGDLARRGAIRAPSRKYWTWAAVAAALTAVATLALFRNAAPEGTKRFVLLLDTVTESYSEMSPEEAAPLAAAYTRWTEEIEARGSLETSYYLKSTTSASGLDAVSGILVVEAASLEDVEAIVERSPHVRRGGTIRIRELAAGR